MSFEAGTLFYAVDADTSGLLRAEKEVDSSTKKVEDRLKQSTDATDKQGAAFKRLNPITRGVKQETDRLSSAVQKTGEGFNKTRALVAGLAALLAGVATNAIVGFIRSSLDAVDAQAKLAAQLDASIGGLRGLQLAANDAGVSTGAINSAAERLNMTLGQASRGAGTAGEALDRLGLSAESLIRMDVDERMAAIADRVQALGLNGAQTADVMRQLGIRQREIVNLMRQGGDAIRDATQEITDYGLAIDAVDAATIEAANDALSRVGLLTESIRNALASELAPIILAVANRFNTAAREAGGWGNVVAGAADTSLTAIGYVADSIEGVRRAFLLAGQGAAVFALVVDRWMAQAEQSIRTQPLQALVDLVGGLKELPGLGRVISGSPLDIFSQTLLAQSRAGQRDIEVLKGAVEAGMADMRETLERPMPSAWMDSLRADIEEARRAIEESITENDGVFDFEDVLESLGSASDKAAEGARNLAREYDSLLDRLFPLEASQRRFAEDQDLLVAAFMAGRITLDQYADALERLEQQARNTGDVWDSYDLFRGNAEGADGDFWTKWLEGAENAFTNFDEMAANTADRFTSAFGNAFERMIFDSQSAGDAFRGLANTMLRSIVNTLGQMAAQWVAYHAVQMALGRTSESAAIAGAAVTGSSIAAAYAPAAAMASLASFGANAAPAMAGITSTVGVAKTAALVGMAHDGIDEVPQEGTWLLDKGERVVGADLNRDLGQFLEREKGGRSSGGDGGGHTSINVNLIESSERAGEVVERPRNDNGRQDIDVFVADIMGDGPRSKAIRSKFGLSPRGR